MSEIHWLYSFLVRAQLTLYIHMSTWNNKVQIQIHLLSPFFNYIKSNKVPAVAITNLERNYLYTYVPLGQEGLITIIEMSNVYCYHFMKDQRISSCYIYD
jgi:hypothetical protein